MIEKLCAKDQTKAYKSIIRETKKTGRQCHPERHLASSKQVLFPYATFYISAISPK